MFVGRYPKTSQRQKPDAQCPRAPTDNRIATPCQWLFELLPHIRADEASLCVGYVLCQHSTACLHRRKRASRHLCVVRSRRRFFRGGFQKTAVRSNGGRQVAEPRGTRGTAHSSGHGCSGAKIGECDGPAFYTRAACCGEVLQLSLVPTDLLLAVWRAT